jgi:Mitochondrial carrier protein
MHPANTMKTLLQNARGPGAPTIAELMQPRNFHRLTVGAGANFLLSVPHGAVNFAVLEFVRKRLGAIVKANPRLAANESKFSFGLDFLSSSISTITCSVVSTPQMMITDNIMAGNYPNLRAAVTGLARSKGIMGFYGGWWPGLVGKIPSYALTWTFFQQLKQARNRLSHRPATDLENSIMGCVASTATVCLMIPMDTIKTRLVSQAGRAASDQAYKGIIDCAVRVFREEGIGTFYRGLPPRLVSVVPMIGIQFGVYEFMKRVMLKRRVAENSLNSMKLVPEYGSAAVLEEAMMEVAASPEHPYPAPQFSKRIFNGNGNGKDSSTEPKKKKTKKEQR